MTTAAGTTLGISASAPATDDEAGYAAITFTEVGQVEKIGAVGGSHKKVDFQPFRGPAQKYKGGVDYGAIQPIMGFDPDDAGQLLLAAADEEVSALYSFCVTYHDGAKRFFRGRVFGFPENIDGADTIVTASPTIEICTRIVKTAAAPTPAPSWSDQPSISGALTVGEILNGDPGTISNGTVSELAWLRGASIISGETTDEYLLVEADEGENISFRVTANGAGGSAQATSDPVGPVEAAPVLPGNITDLDADLMGANGVHLTWTPAADADSHEYRIDGGSWSATMHNDEHHIDDLLYETEYDFEVRGVNGDGNGNASNVATVTTLEEPEFVAPTLTVTDDTTNPPLFDIDTGDAVVGDTFRLIWDDNSGFATPEGYNHVFTSDDVLNGSIDWETLAGFGPFAEETTIYWELEVYRSAALIATSNTVSATILDVTPSAFSFTDVTEATVSTSYESNEITVAGLSTGASVAVTVTGGEYQKNGGPWVSTPGTASNGDDFKVRATSSGSGATAVNAMLTIGGVSDTFTITTSGAGIVPTFGTSPAEVNIGYSADNYTFEDVAFTAGLAVICVTSGHRRIVSVTVGGNAATLVAESSASDNEHASIWQYDGITAGNHDVNVAAASTLTIAIVAISTVVLVGANPTPVDTAAKAISYVADPQVTSSGITGVTGGGIGIATAFCSDDLEPTWNFGTEFADVSGDRRHTSSYFTTDGTPSVSGFAPVAAIAAAGWEPA
jgi:hypothetical protein